MRRIKTAGIALSHRENALKTFQACKPLFLAQGISLSITNELSFEMLRHNQPFRKSDAIFCFGGDGSFLKTCQAIQKQIPVFHVGCGARNELASIRAEEAPYKINEILKGKYRTEKRTRIVLHGNEHVPALNEIVIAPKTSATLLQYHLSIDNRFYWQDYADGILVSTPTGSKAYYQNLHNPCIEASAPVLGIAPLNSSEHQKGIIVTDHHQIQLHHLASVHSIEAILDGQYRISLEKNATIQKSKHDILIGKPLEKSEKKAVAPSLAPSTQFILYHLSQSGGKTPVEIHVETQLQPRTIRRALKELLKKNYIVQRAFPTDKRKTIYQLRTGETRP